MTFTQPHWSDPRVIAVAEAIYDDCAIHTEMAFRRDQAVQFWPGLDARRFVAMTCALDDHAAGYEAALSGEVDQNPLTESPQ